MLHSKFIINKLLVLEKILRVYTIYGHGSHLKEDPHKIWLWLLNGSKNDGNTCI